MSLAARRFPDHITRRREASGSRNEFGEWVPGAMTETALRASVQPVRLEDVDEARDGTRLVDYRKVLVPASGALAAAHEQAGADRVVIEGSEFVVETSESWRGHTRAIVLRAG